MASTSVQSPHTCSDCSKTFPNANQLIRHTVTTHQPTCSIDNPAAESSHLLSRDAKTKCFHCPGLRCAFKHAHPAHVQLHVRKCPLLASSAVSVQERTEPDPAPAPAQRPKVVPCPQCSEMFATKHSAKYHKLLVHQRMCSVTRPGASPLKLVLTRDTGTFHCPGLTCTYQNAYPGAIQDHAKACKLLASSAESALAHLLEESVRPPTPPQEVLRFGCFRCPKRYATHNERVHHHGVTHQRKCPIDLAEHGRLVLRRNADTGKFHCPGRECSYQNGRPAIIKRHAQKCELTRDLDPDVTAQDEEDSAPLRGAPIHDAVKCAVDPSCRYITRDYHRWLAHYQATHEHNLPVHLQGVAVGETTHYTSIRVQIRLQSRRFMGYAILGAPSQAADQDNAEESALEQMSDTIGSDHGELSGSDDAFDMDLDMDEASDLDSEGHETPLRSRTPSVPVEASFPRDVSVKSEESACESPLSGSSVAQSFQQPSRGLSLLNDRAGHRAPSEESAASFALFTQSQSDMRTNVSNAVALSQVAQTEKEAYRRQFAQFCQRLGLDRSQAYSVLVHFKGDIGATWKHIDDWCADMSHEYGCAEDLALEYLKVAQGAFVIAESCIEVSARTCLAAPTLKRSASEKQSDSPQAELSSRSKRSRPLTDGL